MITTDPPTWRGELRSSARAHLLPNVYSARVHQKRGARQGGVARRALRGAAGRARPGYRWPADELDRVWTLLLWNGAHDSSCGCSHDQVALDVDERFAEARATCERIVADALGSLGRSGRVGGRDPLQPVPVRAGRRARDWGGRSGPRTRRRRRRSSSARATTARSSPTASSWSCSTSRTSATSTTSVTTRSDQVPWGPAEIHVEGDGVRAWFDDALEVQMRITRRADEPFIRIEGMIRNGRPDHRLRLHVTLPVRRPPPSPARRSSSSSGRSSGGQRPRNGLADVAGTRRRDGGGHGRDARGRVRVRGGGRPRARGDAAPLRRHDQPGARWRRGRSPPGPTSPRRSRR